VPRYAMVRVEVIIVGTGAVAWQGSDFAQQVARSVEWMSHSPAAYSKKRQNIDMPLRLNNMALPYHISRHKPSSVTLLVPARCGGGGRALPHLKRPAAACLRLGAKCWRR
jgi:hypothetical protein